MLVNYSINVLSEKDLLDYLTFGFSIIAAFAAIIAAIIACKAYNAQKKDLKLSKLSSEYHAVLDYLNAIKDYNHIKSNLHDIRQIIAITGYAGFLDITLNSVDLIFEKQQRWDSKNVFLAPKLTSSQEQQRQNIASNNATQYIAQLESLKRNFYKINEEFLPVTNYINNAKTEDEILYKKVIEHNLRSILKSQNPERNDMQTRPLYLETGDVGKEIIKAIVSNQIFKYFK